MQIKADDIDLEATGELIADGPTETISYAGEMSSVELASSWPLTVDLRDTHSRIYSGIDTEDRTCNRWHLGDVNADCVPDLTCGASEPSGPRESRWHSVEYSTVFARTGRSTDLQLANGDHDIDRLSQLADNGPLVANSNQLDSDGDLRGDACALG